MFTLVSRCGTEGEQVSTLQKPMDLWTCLDKFVDTYLLRAPKQLKAMRSINGFSRILLRVFSN